jgi:hypothetical protein
LFVVVVVVVLVLVFVNVFVNCYFDLSLRGFSKSIPHEEELKIPHIAEETDQASGADEEEEEDEEIEAEGLMYAILPSDEEGLDSDEIAFIAS